MELATVKIDYVGTYSFGVHSVTSTIHPHNGTHRFVGRGEGVELIVGLVLLAACFVIVFDNLREFEKSSFGFRSLVHS